MASEGAMCPSEPPPMKRTRCGDMMLFGLLSYSAGSFMRARKRVFFSPFCVQRRLPLLNA